MSLSTGIHQMKSYGTGIIIMLRKHEIWEGIRRPISTLPRDLICEKSVQVLPIIKSSPSYPNGKILLGKWKSGNYMNRYTGLIDRIPYDDQDLPREQFRRKLESIATSLVPVEIRDFIDEIKCKGILKFDGPPDNLEYIYVASVRAHIQLKNPNFPSSYPYRLDWFDINEIPFEKMPADDSIWYPLVLEGKKVRGSFIFGGNAERGIKSYTIEEAVELEV